MTRGFLPSLLFSAALATAACTLSMLTTPSAHAQAVTGNITGLVTDASGAVIPSASVVAHNLDTGVDSSTTTNASGAYNIRFLPIGRYSVSISAQGFSNESLPAFQLEILQTANFNVKLKVGSAAETVQVSAAAPILNTNDPTLGTTFSANEISNVPLSGLNFSTLTQYLPGAVNTNGTSGLTGNNAIERATYYSDIPSINGNRSQANNYTIDGIDNNETFNNLIAYNPAPDSLAEMKVVTANAPADYGNVNGGGVLSVLKSGTNKFHGSAYGYLQDYHLNANSWANDNASPVVAINSYSQSQFGGTFGGPIFRNKLFFFVDYLGSRYHTSGTQQASVLTDQMRQGDFSILLAQGTPVQLYDTQNNFTPYANNKGITIQNPVAKFLLANPSLYPSPNATATDGIAANNYQGYGSSYVANNQGDAKIEFDPSQSDKLTGFYSMSTGYDGQSPLLDISFSGPSLYPTKLGGATWVHIFSPSLVNSARVGFTRVIWQTSNPADPSGEFGLTGNAKVGITFGTQSDPGYSYQNITGGITGGGTPAYDSDFADNTYTYTDNLTWQRGHHSLSMGVQALRYQNNFTTGNSYGFLGQLYYTGDFTGNGNGTSGYGAADFLLDRVTEAAVTAGTIRVGQRQWRAAGFVMDDWKVLPNLTINAGMRYEFDQPWYETNNKTGNIDLTTGQPIYANSVPANAPAGSGVCSNRACYDANYTQFMPRLGFALQATNRFVIRGGYGATSFFEGNSYNQRLTSITPFISATDIKLNAPTISQGVTPRTAEEGFTNGTAGDVNLSGSSYNVYPKHIQPAYIQEWNLTTEYALTRSLSLQVGYLGEQGQHIEDYGNVNQYTVNGDSTSAPYYNNQYLGVNAEYGVGANKLLITESRAAMDYNALQATLRERSYHGLEYTINYTWGKAMTNSLGNYALNVNGYSGAFQNYYDSRADWGLAGTDVQHNLNGVVVYDLPFGRGRDFGSHINHWADMAVGGWKLSLAGMVYSGFPETITGPDNNSNSYGSTRANQYRHMRVVGRSYRNWFGTDASAKPCLSAGVDNGVCAFGSPAVNAFGSSRNGSVRGPGFANADASAFKDVHIVSTQTIGFRFDAFNVFNHPSYTNPDTNITNATFGQAIGTRSTERRIQMALRYNF